MHWMCHIMVLRCSSRKEAALTKIEVETLETTEAETDYRVFFAYLTLRFMFYSLGRGQAMKCWDPDDALRFFLHPVKELLRANGFRFFRLEKKTGK